MPRDHMEPLPVAIFIDPDSIEVWTNAGEPIRSARLTLGDSWRVGAIDKKAFPYEVLIVVVNRSE